MTSAHALITAERVFALMNEPARKRQKLWTPSLVIERLGISRYPTFAKDHLKRARKVLELLWKEEEIIKKTRSESRFTLREIAFMRIADAPLSYYIHCPLCESDRLVENGIRKACKNCPGSPQTVIRPYP